MAVLFFVAGLTLLIVGAEALVRGSSRLAATLGISPLVIGLTVVAFGTSSPELAVSIKSVMAGQADMAVGNVVGSNIFNVLLILGLSALIAPLVVSQQLIRLDVPLMIAVSVLALVLGLDGVFDRTDGLLLFSGLVGYIGFLIYQSRKESAEVKNEYAREFGQCANDANEPGQGPSAGSVWAINIGFVIGGLVLLVLGSRWLVESAVTFAQYLGVSQLVIGLTIVAAGTSLPELVTSIIASIRGERDIAVGNVVGSNLFNIMGVLGLSSMVAPAGVGVSTAVIGFDLPIMIVVAFACLPIFFTGGVISRFEGALLLGYYLAYTLYLVLATSHHDALPMFSAVMLYFAIPLTLGTLILISVRALRKPSRIDNA